MDRRYLLCMRTNSRCRDHEKSSLRRLTLNWGRGCLVQSTTPASTNVCGASLLIRAYCFGMFLGTTQWEIKVNFFFKKNDIKPDVHLRKGTIT